MPAPSASRPPLDRAAVAAALAGTRWRPRVLPEAASTNALAAEAARAGAAEGLVVITDHQTAGRGRLDRSWVTPPGVALTCSLVLVPTGVPVTRWPWLPLLAGIAVAEAVRRVGRVAAMLKWPNDVLVDDGASRRKVCGILVERVEVPRGGAAAVVGIGVNVLQTPGELPVDTATSLAQVSARPLDRVMLLAAVLDELGARYDRWVRDAGDPVSSGLHSAYTTLCVTLGEHVRVRLSVDQDLVGDAVGVDEDGRLRVSTAEGVVAVGAGDVVHVRRSG